MGNLPQPKKLVTRGQKSANRLSPDGKWRSFPRVPRLPNFVGSAIYFARIGIEGKLIREQFLNRRIPDIARMRSEVAALELDRNNRMAAIDRRSTTEDARIKLKRLYPKLWMFRGTKTTPSCGFWPLHLELCPAPEKRGENSLNRSFSDRALSMLDPLFPMVSAWFRDEAKEPELSASANSAPRETNKINRLFPQL